MKPDNTAASDPADDTPGLRRVLKNAGALLGGKAVGGVLSLAYLGVAARSLGPHDMGVLVLVHAYAMTIAGIARFQSWQAVIRFGVPMIAAGDNAAFRALTRFTIRLDLVSAVLAVVVAVAGAPVAARYLGWSDDVLGAVYVYCLAIPFLIAATPTGVLRLFGRFRLLSLQLTLMPGIRFVGALALWAVHGDVRAFIAVWIAGAFISGAGLWFLGLRELKQRKLTPKLIAPEDAPRDPVWTPFVIKTQLSSTIDLASGSIPVLIVGAITGGAAAGFLQVAINVTNLLAHPTNMLNQATYPELARVAAEKGRVHMVALAWRSILAAFAVAIPLVLGFIFLRQQIAVTVAGAAFLAAAPLIALMAVAQPFRIASVVMDSAVLARGRAGVSLAAQAIAATLNLGGLVVLLPGMGVIVAPIVLAVGWAAMVCILTAGALRR